MKKLGPIIAPRKGLTAIPQLEYGRYNDTVNFSHNPIKIINLLPTLSGYQNLILDDTKLESFDGAFPQPDIQNFSCINTPLGQSKYLQVMSLIVFGDQLKIINNQNVTQKAINLAKQYQDDLYNYLTHGWVITSLSPLRVANVQTKERKLIQPSKDGNDEVCIYIPDDENLEADNTQNDAAAQSEDVIRKLRYRFNQLVHPKITTKTAAPAKTQKPKKAANAPQKTTQQQKGKGSTQGAAQKQEGQQQETQQNGQKKQVKSTSISYRQQVRTSPIRAKLQTKKMAQNKSPFELQRELKKKEERERLEQQKSKTTPK